MKPYKCPKCEGKGLLKYDPKRPLISGLEELGPWKCDKCDGGIIWQEDVAIVYVPNPYHVTPYVSHDPFIYRPFIVT